LLYHWYLSSNVCLCCIIECKIWVVIAHMMLLTVLVPVPVPPNKQTILCETISRRTLCGDLLCTSCRLLQWDKWQQYWCIIGGSTPVPVPCRHQTEWECELCTSCKLLHMKVVLRDKGEQYLLVYHCSIPVVYQWWHIHSWHILVQKYVPSFILKFKHIVYE
jgi:hypothetical protein